MPDSSKDTTGSAGTGASGSDQSTGQASSQPYKLLLSPEDFSKIKGQWGKVSKSLDESTSATMDLIASFVPAGKGGKSEKSAERLRDKTDQAREESEQPRKSQDGGEQSSDQSRDPQ